MDANADGKKDLLFAGNNSWTRIKFGQYTASNGTLVSSTGKGNYTYVPQWKSGLNIRGNVRSLVSVGSGNNSGTQFVFGINNAESRIIKVK